ncbi:MAG: hypothetical protein A3F74_16085 [Betaproteobacteria bacterium RIFCSPLOWO2_12_FULL_62_58]|nr:MAG: hypothetical protein A3I62_05535 [Betaproteobacteria bacterium RIFCSPLOWO2_02_FULL_62_79]OGA51827.1 MAG: hypothetical protein A3F74_16085 [Betaproteobacteria bacterium RIFCSPLOWO2_12_FULL_62_58]
MTITSASHRTSGRSRPPGTQDAREVPDPYYGGPQSFELALELIENAAQGLPRHIRAQLTD